MNAQRTSRNINMNDVNNAIKNVLKSSRVGGFFYKRVLQPLWRMYRVPRDRKLMALHGYEVLSRIHQVMKKHAIPYYCDAGTLLGFIRDGGFIKGDDDFDFSIMPEPVGLGAVLKILVEEGYGYVHAFEYGGRVLECTVSDPYIGLPIDFFQSEYCDDKKMVLLVRYLRWFEDRDYTSSNDNSVLEFRFPSPSGIKEIEVHGVETSVPTNAEDILDAEYGPWRRPDPNFKSDMIPHVEAQAFAHKLTLKEALRFA